MKKITLLIGTVLSLLMVSCTGEMADGIYANITTNKGAILISLEYDKVPLTVANFIGLAEGKIIDSNKEGPFYDGLNFHRVTDDIMIQGGCPDGNGQGGPGYNISDEFHDDLQHDSPGVLSMMNAGLPNNNGSQFFITLRDFPQLDGRCSVFGFVNDSISLSIVNSIEQNDSIETIKIIRVGKEAKKFNAVDVFSKKQIEMAEEEKVQKEEMNKQLEKLSADANITDSGLRYIMLEEGNGDTPESGDNVSVHYAGFLLDGTKFDASYDRGEPITFPLGQGRVIKGWDEGVSLLKVGGKAKFIIPPNLGYGDRAMGPIPANSILIFEVELVDIVK